MLLDKFKRKAKEVTLVNGAFLGIAVMSVAANMALSVKIMDMHERLVISPPYVNEKMEIAWDSANQEYVKSFGLYLSGVIGNITPKNADFIIETLSYFLDPSIYSEARIKLKSMTSDPVFNDSGVFSYYLPNGIVYEPETKKVFVLGDLVMGSAARAPKPTPMVYEFKIVISKGRPLVKSIDNYSGTEARTAQWKLNHPEFKEGSSK